MRQAAAWTHPTRMTSSPESQPLDPACDAYVTWAQIELSPQTPLPTVTLNLNQKHPTAFHGRPTGRRLFRCRVVRAGGMALRAAPKMSEMKGPPESSLLHAPCMPYVVTSGEPSSGPAPNAPSEPYYVRTLPVPLRRPAYSFPSPPRLHSSGRASRSLSFRPTETVSTVHIPSFPSSDYLIQCDAEPRRR